MAVIETGAEPLLASWSVRLVLAPTRTLPKLSDAGETPSAEVLDTPATEMYSSDVPAFEEISTALARTPGPACDALCGVKATVMGQVAPGTMVEQLPATVKSGEVWMLKMLSVAVPVLASVTVCAAELAPAEVLAKLSELADGARATSGATFDGEATATGVELPVRLTRSGLDAASLSMISVPVSVLGAEAPDPAATWLMGA